MNPNQIAFIILSAASSCLFIMLSIELYKHITKKR